MDNLFDFCVQLLEHWASSIGMTYKEINIWIFVITEPIVFLLMSVWIILLLKRIRKYKLTVKRES